MRLSVNKFLVFLGLVILGKGGHDIYNALWGTTTFTDIKGINVEIELVLYFFGFVYTGVCLVTKHEGVIAFSKVVGFACLLISSYGAYDMWNDTTGASYDCVSNYTGDALTKCLNKLM